VFEVAVVTDRWTNAQAALRPVVGGGEIQVIGALSEPVALVLGLPTTVRTVFVHPDTIHHVAQGRRSDTEFVLQYMPAAILQPHYCGQDPRHQNRYDLVHVEHGGERAVLVAIKFVSAVAAGSLVDELWVSTGYPLRRGFLKRRRWKESLKQAPSVNP
jgi:hypothetical protein